MCNEISNLIVSGNGGVLYFENQIWAIVLIFPVGEGNKLIDRSIINDEQRIIKLYIQVNDQERRAYLQNFKVIL